MRLLGEGHQVRAAVSNPKAVATMRGLVPHIDNWRGELEWVREVGRDGVILFEAVSEGFGAIQDALRAQGYQVIGGSAFGDRLENDRAFGQTVLGDLGFPTGHVWEFTDAASAIEHLQARPRRTVLKYSGSGKNGANFVGQLDDGADVLALLRQHDPDEGERFILMDFINGIEVGVGAYFDGARFLLPACVDWEHKRFFAGDMGELTGEMGTVATFSRTDQLFDATLRKVEPLLAGRSHVGYVNLNTIVNEDGIWPLEFTCRFGYPGFAVLEALQRTSWSQIFSKLLAGGYGRIDVEDGFCTGVVMTVPPFPYSREQVEAPIGLPILLRGDWPDGERAHLHLGEIEMRNGQLLTAGLYGWTAVMTGTGPTIAVSSAECYRRCARIIIPNGRYRLDIGERVPDEIMRLNTLGLFDPQD